MTFDLRTCRRLALTFGIAGILTLTNASAEPVSDTEMIGDASFASPVQTVVCAPGAFLAGMQQREGEWLAHVRILCTRPTPTAGWNSPAAFAGEAGGDGGDRVSTITCPADSFIAAFQGYRVLVSRGIDRVTNSTSDTYVAGLEYLCVNRATGEETKMKGLPVKGDDGSRTVRYLPPPGDQRYGGAPDDLHVGAPRGCPTQWAAIGVRVIVGDDIRAFGLVCAPVPFTQKPPPALITTVPPAHVDTAATTPTWIYPAPAAANGQPLDYCLRFGDMSSCGKPTADAFCATKGYNGADSFKGYVIRKETTTLSGAACTWHSCWAFDEITCHH